MPNVVSLLHDHLQKLLGLVAWMYSSSESRRRSFECTISTCPLAQLVSRVLSGAVCVLLLLVIVLRYMQNTCVAVHSCMRAFHAVSLSDF